MAAPTYSINGGSEIHGVVSTWERLRKRAGNSGVVEFTNYAVNRWQLARMDMTNFETLRAAQGDALTSLETNDITDRDANATYTTAFVGIVNGRQEGVRAEDVTVEFRVKVV